LSPDDLQAAVGFVVGSTSRLPAEKCVRTPPLKALDEPEQIPDAKGSLTNEQLKELAKQHKPPASWFEGDEEQLF
jgi:hypothetical protein